MKRSIILSFLLALLFVTCRKEDNPLLPDLTRVPVPLITKDPAGDPSISGLAPETFVGKFIVDVYFKNDVKPQKVDVVVMKNQDTTNIKLIQADVTTFPTTIEITGPQLATLFGEPIILGDDFDIGANVTTITGQTFLAFPLKGAPYGDGIYGMPGSSPILRYSSVCDFDNANFNGNYKVTEDTWQDFGIGELVEVKPGAGPNEISVTAYPSPAFGSNRQPMIVVVDPLTSEATVAEQVIGDYDGAPVGSTVEGTGSVSPCGDFITLDLILVYAGTGYPVTLTLEK